MPLIPPTHDRGPGPTNRNASLTIDNLLRTPMEAVTWGVEDYDTSSLSPPQLRRARKIFEWKFPFWWPWAIQTAKFALISTADSLNELGGAISGRSWTNTAVRRFCRHFVANGLSEAAKGLAVRGGVSNDRFCPRCAYPIF